MFGRPYLEQNAGAAPPAESVSSERPRTVSEVVETITVTCAFDSRAHMVSDVEFTAPAGLDSGRYLAICGRVIWAAPMVAPEGKPCPLCMAANKRVARRA